jgi:polar amino acid transport system substrate-binding protein
MKNSATEANFSPASALAPQGLLRACINLGNPMLANRNAAGEVFGVSVDLAAELAKQLGAQLQLQVVDGAAKSVEAVTLSQADVGFFAIDPLRGAGIHFTAPYVLLEGLFAVRQGSPLQTAADVAAQPGVRIAAGQGSAYELFLSRELKHAHIVKGVGAAGALAAFHAQQLDALSGIRKQMEDAVAADPALRLLSGSFMQIQQAMGCTKRPNDPRSDAAAQHLRSFVDAMKASGFVADALARHRIEGVTVAP